MNWKRVLLFTLALTVATAAVAFPFGFVRGFLSSGSREAPLWLPLLQGVAVVGATAAVGVVLGYRQREQVVLHGGAVVLGTWLLSLPINVGLFGQPPLMWFLGVFGLLFFVGIGVGVGVTLRTLRQGSAAA